MKIRNQKKSEATRSREMEEEIRSRAALSLAILGMAFVRNGSGRFLNIDSSPRRRFRFIRR